MLSLGIIACVAVIFALFKKRSHMFNQVINALIRKYWKDRDEPKPSKTGKSGVSGILVDLEGVNVPDIKEYETHYTEKQLLARNLYTLEMVIVQLGAIQHAILELATLFLITLIVSGVGMAVYFWFF